MRHSINGIQHGTWGLQLDRSIGLIGPSETREEIPFDENRRQFAQRLAWDIHSLCETGCSSQHLPTMATEIEITTIIEEIQEEEEEFDFPEIQTTQSIKETMVGFPDA